MNKKFLKSPFRNLFVGVDTFIPLSNGRWVKAINFDNAATTPPLWSVIYEIINFSPWYSSIHRGTGYKSQFSSSIYEKCREIVRNFVEADEKKDTVIFVKNATEAINKIAYRLCSEKKVVLSTYMEHHSNDLPWRNHYHIDYIQVNTLGKLCLDDLKNKLEKYKDQVALVTVTGASNVTGYKNPIHEIGKLAHMYGAQILVDGAQLIPHGPFSMKGSHPLEYIDYVVFSAHKMYAPFGSGVLIGSKNIFENGPPEYPGGGTVDMVTHDFIKWTEPPSKEESGTPNLMGVLALTKAIQTLSQIGMDHIEKYERNLIRYTLKQLKNIPYIKIYGDEDYEDRISIISFNMENIPHNLLAYILSCESGIAVRNGCFCAQPYIQNLLGLSQEDIEERINDPLMVHPGMVRISFGLYNDYDEIDVFINMLKKISKNRDFYINKYKDFDSSL
ncbi:aminotransferase class V-fold PLP-dependent enzyme [Inediibacterium massiliense]|uniref:aminotransferase class V-fold PLP-dependent enzyme n=1 Tax=Inediibacterium massiliense TaxID=1658111 RepID=UPI0006B60D2E|nr:aminotransferase class V-fold PLP-dependent enzyme [Inediibacterium massiliense]